MAAAYVGAGGSATTTVSSNTIAVTTTRQIDVGQTLLVAVMRTNAHGNVTGISFSAGAATCRQDAIRSVNTGLEIWSCDVTTQIPNGSTVTITFTSTSANVRTAVLEVASGLLTNPKDVSSVSGNVSSTTAATGTTGATAQADEFDFAVFAFADGATCPTVNSVDNGFTLASNLAGTSIGRVTTAYKVVAATGTQTVNGTASAAATSDNGVVAYKAAAVSAFVPKILGYIQG